MITAQDLTLVPQFEDLSVEDRTWLASHFAEVKLEAGDDVFVPGAEAPNMIVIFEGGFQFFSGGPGTWRLVAAVEAGAITGMLPYSRMTHIPGRGTAVEPTKLGLLHKDIFPEMLYRIPVLGQRLIALLSDRVRSGAKADQEREKMLALGKLSAGLAHELNNPAAAVRRAASDLRERLEALPQVVARVARHGLGPDMVNPSGGFCTVSGANPKLSTLELADREDAVLDWLEDREVDDAWKIAPNLAEAGMTPADLDLAVREVPAGAIADVVAWIENSISSSRLLDEIHAAAGRVSDLVGSVKAYSHMDRSPEKELTNLGSGIGNTLTMLGHKIRKKAIDVHQLVPGDLPLVPGHPGELNQVWTNLIDNAVDAMDDEGQLTIAGKQCGRSVEISIEDSGHGIPEDVVSKIFEPFFTTKDVGQGTGLGLEIVHRIITEQHEGNISVESRPGSTVFTITLPMDGASA
jgi:signal transduction histidine kinase